MRYDILKRLLTVIPVLLGVTFLSFAMMRLAGGDAVTYLYENAGAAVSEEAVQAAREAYGLDRPFLVQYGSWLAGMLTGDMGVSYVSGRDVSAAFAEKLPCTLLLTCSALLFTLAAAFPLGVRAAVGRGGKADLAIRLLSFAGSASPGFFTALLLMYVFSVKLRWLPVITTEDTARSLLLPSLTLAVPMIARYTRQIRAAVLEELGKDYVTGARARGIPEGTILKKSVLRCILPAIIQLLALSAGSLLGGAAIVETIFMWDGVGKLAVDAISMRDYPIIQAYVAWMAVIYVLVNLAADILLKALDHRVRSGGAGA